MYNIIKSVDLPDYLSFKSECDCGTHDLRVTLEKDANDYIALGLEDKLYVDAIRSDDPWYKNLWRRVGMAFKILFRGWVEVDYEFVFKDKEHVYEFVNFLNHSIKQMEAPADDNEGCGA